MARAIIGGVGKRDRPFKSRVNPCRIRRDLEKVSPPEIEIQSSKFHNLSFKVGELTLVTSLFLSQICALHKVRTLSFVVQLLTREYILVHIIVSYICTCSRHHTNLS